MHIRNLFLLAFGIIIAIAPFASSQELVLVTERHLLNFTDDNWLEISKEKLPRFGPPQMSYADLSEIDEVPVTFTSFDAVTIIFANRSFRLDLSEVTLESFKIRFLPNTEFRDGTVGVPIYANLSSRSDIIITITSVNEYLERYEKVILRDYKVNATLKKVNFPTRIELPKKEPAINATPEIKPLPPKEGTLSIETRSSVERPVSAIVGSIIIGVIITAGIAIYLVLRKAVE